MIAGSREDVYGLGRRGRRGKGDRSMVCGRGGTAGGFLFVDEEKGGREMVRGRWWVGVWTRGRRGGERG